MTNNKRPAPLPPSSTGMQIKSDLDGLIDVFFVTSVLVIIFLLGFAIGRATL